MPYPHNVPIPRRSNVDFLAKLKIAARTRGSWLCVGLDPIVEKLPACLPRSSTGVTAFCQRIIESTAPHACAFKPNIAFFEALGRDAFSVLEDVISSVPEDIPVILDAKRGDIGSTAHLYARSYFEKLGVDAVTLSPYLGWDAIEPFLRYPGKAVFVLCLTSNPSAAQIQMLPCEGEPLYVRVARLVQSQNPSTGLVVGGTRPEQIGIVREICPESPFLIPGIGAQGGDLELSVRLGSWKTGGGALINASRAVLYTSNGEDFAEAAGGVAAGLKEEIARAGSAFQRSP